MKKILNKKYTILLFVILYVFGLFFLKDVNSNFDENLEQTILKRNLIEYGELFKIDRVTNSFRQQGIVPISTDSEKDHGIAAYYAFTPLLKLKAISPSYLSIGWHVYTYTIFFVGFILLYKLLNYLFKNKKVSTITSLLYFLSPRILVDSFNNNKDIVFMSLLIMMIYFATKFIKERKWKDAAFFAFFAGFVCNVKILGIFFFGIFGLCYIFTLIYKKEINKQNVLKGLFVAISGLLFFFILTPAMWGSGIDIIGYFKYCLENSTNFRGQISVFFEGTWWGGNNDPIPWYYLPKLMLLTLPIITSVLFISGIVLFIKNTITNIIKKNKMGLEYLIVIGALACFAVPFFVCVFKHPNIYNGWRHFYFLYGLMFIVIGYAVSNLSKTKLKKVLIVTIGVTLIVNVFYLFKYGVKNTAYYNILMNRDNIQDRYELDYYNTTSKDSINEFMANTDLKYNSNNKIYLYGNGFNQYSLTDVLVNNVEYNDKFEVVTKDELDELLEKGEPVYEKSILIYSELKGYKKELVYSYKIFGSDISRFYLIEGVNNE